MHSQRNVCDLAVLPQLFHQLADPRDVRHPYAVLCSLVFLGMLAGLPNCNLCGLSRREVRWYARVERASVLCYEP